MCQTYTLFRNLTSTSEKVSTPLWCFFFFLNQRWWESPYTFNIIRLISFKGDVQNILALSRRKQKLTVNYTNIFCYFISPADLIDCMLSHGLICNRVASYCTSWLRNIVIIIYANQIGSRVRHFSYRCITGIYSNTTILNIDQCWFQMSVKFQKHVFLSITVSMEWICIKLFHIVRLLESRSHWFYCQSLSQCTKCSHQHFFTDDDFFILSHDRTEKGLGTRFKTEHKFLFTV